MSKALENMSREELLKENKRLEVQTQQLKSQTQQLEAQAQHLKFQLSQLRRLMFGAKRERFIATEENAKQLKLPFEVPETEPKELETEDISYSRKKKKRDKHPGRLPLPDHLPVEEIVLEPKENTTGMKCIGEEITDKLEYIPASLYIIRYRRKKYISDENPQDGSCKGVIAALPSFPLEKAIAGAGLLAQIMVDKYVDHIPVYRQVQRFSREKIRIPANTIYGWQDGVSRLLYYLHEKQKQLVLGQGYLQVDETPIRVLDKDVKGKCHQGYYWVYNSPLQDAVLFDYRKGRGREGPKEMLRDFKGYIQSDGYAVYDWFGKKEEITLLNCWAHARRYFIKAQDYDKKSAEHVLKKIQLLYKIERFSRNMQLTTDQRKELRLEHALPVINELGKWISQQFKQVLPKSPMGEALNYCVARWDNLLAYLHDGHLEIDNNLVENAIRPNALGRKNYLFAGSHDAAQRAAMFYSFFGTCKRHNINPQHWLKDVLERVKETKSSQLHELLPQNWKKYQSTPSPQ